MGVAVQSRVTWEEAVKMRSPHGCLMTEESSFGCNSLSPLGLSQVPFQTSPQLSRRAQGPLIPTRPLPPSLGPGRKEAGGFVCANCIVRAKVLELGCLIWGLY